MSGCARWLAAAGTTGFMCGCSAGGIIDGSPLLEQLVSGVELGNP